ncbi:NnrS family protein [Dongia sp.]|uniref:NnrS family protein n=1 Tax=Dongia sp. TaxID=1977262 RepID=UPI0035AE32F8
MRLAESAAAPRLAVIMGDEGLRLFFPPAALHGALWPFLWTVLYGLDMPVGGDMPPSLWHATEMIFGTYGAALIGFITTAIPEWTDRPRPKGRTLFALAGLWGVGRIAGLIGNDMLGILGGLADSLWLLALVAYVARSWIARPHVRLFAPLFWLGGLAAAGIVVRAAFALGDAALAHETILIAGLMFLGLLGVVLARVTVPVTNLVLDPSEVTSPYRPHPGRINLAPGLVLVVVLAQIAGLSPAVTGFLFIASGAAFMDRVAEAFVGKEAFRPEIVALSCSSMFSGAGLILVGASRLGAPFSETPALHLALMGGLGIGVLSIFAIAGLMHTGRRLPLPRLAVIALVLMAAAVLLRVLPELGVLPWPPGPPYALAAVTWATAFLLWLRGYWPFLSTPNAEGDGCGDRELSPASG